MKRRSFLQLAGGACTSAMLGWSADSTRTGRIPKTEEGEDVYLDRDRLQNRNSNRSEVVCQNGVVCTSQPLAALAGIDVLKSGGNAIDAAVCASAMLSLVEPMSCGPGGDLFAIVWSARDKKLYGLNASGRSPYDWSLTAARDMNLKSIPVYHPLAWSVPGCVSGWDALLQRFGTRKFAQLLAAPIEYAQSGFPVSPIIASKWVVDGRRHPTLAQTYAPNGRTPQFGDIFRNPQLARFFQIIAQGGAEAFYLGEVAERIVKFSRDQGGRFSMRDFIDHKANWIEPVRTCYRGFDLWELPPNGQGIAALQIINMLEQFDIGALQPNSAEHLHLFLEAKKLAFEDRAVYYADMDFADVPLRRLISKEYGKERAKLINPQRAAQKVAAGRIRNSADTIYLTTADQDGNMVSFIQSIYHGWGSHIVPDQLGFALQNRGLMFSLDSQALNKLEPHKRPFHTIIPAFLTKEGQPVFSFGVMGGDFQPQGHVQVLMNIIDFGMSPQQAGDQPRVSHFESSTPMGDKMIGGGSVGLERRIPDAVKQKLADMGHAIRDEQGAYGGYQGIWREENPRRYFGASESRKDGCAIGY